MLVEESNKEIQVQEPFSLGLMDSFSKVLADKGKPLSGGNEGNKEGEVSAEEKARLADEEIKKREAQRQGGQEASKDDELTDEQIQTKLDELAKKEDKDLTEEEKKFIQEKTGEEAVVDEITRVKGVFESKYGVELKNQYENSEVGLTQMVDEVAPVIAEQILADYFSNVPHMKAFYDHVVVEGRGLETFLLKNDKPGFLNIPVKEITSDMDKETSDKVKNNLKNLIKIDLQQKGVDESSIEDLIALAESGDKLYEKGKAAKENLVKSHQLYVDNKLKAEEATKAAEIKRYNDELAAQIAMVDKNNFNGISIPAADVKAFKEALTRKDPRGNTLLDYKRAKLTLDQLTLIDYLVFKDVKIPGLSKAVAQNGVKKFNFKKAAEQNDERGGGRTRAGNDNTMKGQEMIFDPRTIDFNRLGPVQKDTIN